MNIFNMVSRILNHIKICLVVFICLVFVTACGDGSKSSVSNNMNKQETDKVTSKSRYNTYAECMKDEIRKNDGKENRFINQYCRESFPTKTYEEEYIFAMGGSELVVKSEYRRRGDSIRIARDRDTTGEGTQGYWLRLYNQSNRNVTSLKVWNEVTSGNCRRVVIDWDNVPNLLPGNQAIRPGESMWIIKDSTLISRLCYAYLAKEISYTTK